MNELNSLQNEVEVWKDVPEYEGSYQISTFGRLRSLDRYVGVCGGGKRLCVGSEIKQFLGNTGYLICTLSLCSKINPMPIHQIMAITFLNHAPNGFKFVVNHINGDRLDNRLINLNIVTNRENTTTCFRSNRETFTSRFTGVSWYKRREKWESAIRFKGSTKHLGMFENEIDASDAYQKALKSILNGYFEEYYGTIKKKVNTSRFIGVHWVTRSKRWEAKITINGKCKYIGKFKIEQDASDAYQRVLKSIQLN